MVRVLLSNEVENFEVKGSYSDHTGESNDGMRRGIAYTVRTECVFVFHNGKKTTDGYEYDMEVSYHTSNGVNEDWTETPKAFQENFDQIYTCLRFRSLRMLNYSAKMAVQCDFDTARGAENWNGETFATQPDEDAIWLEFNGRVSLSDDDEATMTAEALLKRVQEQDEQKGERILARALHNLRKLKASFSVDADSVPDEYFGKKYFIALKRVSLNELLQNQLVSVAEVQQALMDYAADIETKGGEFYALDTDQLEQYITTLPGDWPARVLRYCHQTRDNLDLYREYCPQAIPWREMKSEDYREGDLDLMIRYREPACNCEQWEFIEVCMRDPELERKVVENAGIIGLYSYGRIGRNLHTLKASDVLRAVLRHLDTSSGKVYLDHFKHLAELKLEEGLTERDYQDFLRVARRLDKTSSDVAGLALKIGKSAGMSDAELVKMLEQKEFTSDLCGSGLYRAYHDTQFAPGLAWIEARRMQREAEKQAEIEARERSYAAVVDYVLQSKKTAVPVEARYSFDEEGAYEIARPDGTKIGTLRGEEKRVLRIEGHDFSYLVNVARAKRPKNGVLHIDILEVDAGYVIGPKGAHLEKVAQKLREYGCDVQTVRVHKHKALDD